MVYLDHIQITSGVAEQQVSVKKEKITCFDVHGNCLFHTNKGLCGVSLVDLA
jgi:hypothetical protein